MTTQNVRDRASTGSRPAAAQPTADKTAAPERGGRRSRIRSKPGIGQLYVVLVFVVGLVFIVGGFALAVLPGPLTIPPVLAGLWIWSKEFTWAERLFDSMKAKGAQAWRHAKARPASSAAITVAGLAAAAAAVGAISYFEVVDRARDAIGV
jgi:hypothetical protein